MPRRRAEREQQRDEFLQQNPELIRVETEISVVLQDGEDDGVEPAIQITIDGMSRTGFGEDDRAQFEDGFLIESLPVEPVMFIQAGENPVISGFDTDIDRGFLTVTEEGFGVATVDEIPLESNGEDQGRIDIDDVDSDVEEDVPEGARTISGDEGLLFQTFAADSIGISFMIEGNGGAELSAFTPDEEGPNSGTQVSETFTPSRGAGADDVFYLEVDDPDKFFVNAAFTATGNAEVTVVAIHVESAAFFLGA